MERSTVLSEDGCVAFFGAVLLALLNSAFDTSIGTLYSPVVVIGASPLDLG